MEKLIQKIGKKEFEQYKSRKIEFIKTVAINDFNVKIYTITNRTNYESKTILEASVNSLSDWLQDAKSSSIVTHKHAFLIVHEAREGVLILLSWWTGENMIETKIYFSNFENPSKIEPSIYDPKQLVCVWELEIFYHERKAWIEHVLSKSENPDFENYSNDYYTQVL